MKKLVFIAHDPGGHSVIHPIYLRLEKQCRPVELHCLGPAGSLSPENATAEEALISRIERDIDRRAVAAVVTGTSWGSDIELRIIRLCKSKGIPTFAVLDYWSSYKQRFLMPNEELVIPDSIVVMDELAKDEAIADGLPAESILVLGHPGLDGIVELPKIVRRNKERKSILFLSQPISLLYGEKLGYTEEIVIQDCIRALEPHDNIDFYIKFHPKDSETLKTRYLKCAATGILPELFYEHDGVVGMSSIALLHASILNHKVISYQPGLIGNDLSITNRLGMTKSVSTFAAFQTELNRMIVNTPGSNNSFWPKDRFIWMDGNSTDRIASLIGEKLK